jgi:alginate O-acetyltransferase complex protein AlgJ
MTEHETRQMRVDGVDARVTIAVFMLALIAWSMLTLTQEPKKFSTLEQRILAEWPTYDASAGGLTEYRLGLERYLDDHLALRSSLISLHARAKVGWLGTSPSPKVIVGKQGWFFLNDEVAVAQYRGTARLEATQLETWQRVLEARRDWLQQRGIAFMLVLVPNKHQVYSEFMPDGIPRFGAEEQHVQLAAHLAEHSTLQVVDLLPSLLEAKEEQRVYHRTDTHWNDVGAYLGYKKILEALAIALPEYAGAIHPSEVRLNRYTDKGIGLTSMIALSDVYREEVLQLEQVDPQSQILTDRKKPYKQLEREQQPLAHGVPGAALPRAVVFRDSFANALIPYLSENFRRVLYVWSRDVDPRIVEREKPDIVIQQIAGRLLDRTPIGIRDSATREAFSRPSP